MERLSVRYGGIGVASDALRRTQLAVVTGVFMKSLRVFLTVCLIVGSQAAAAQQEGFVPASTTGDSVHFEFDDPFGYSSADSRALRGEFDEIFETVAGRLDVSLEEKVVVRFAPPNPGPCPSRGWTMVSPGQGENDSLPMIVVFADENTDPKQVSAVLAHEVGHVLQHVAVEGGRSIRSIFLEGFATWAAGPYWLEWQGAASFRAAVASYITAETYLPLHENDGFLDTLSEEAVARFGQDCLNRRDVIYTEWAAFIEYLVEEHGKQRMYSLFQTAPLVNSEEATPFMRPNFPAVYGRSLKQLEAAWLEQISSND